ncbi:MAG: GNAT family N-acetyltransferase [Hyphomicrobiaceae bacterium]|nr:GNAT family N-acetyltransferase [Hyphomicrobiaceae bacterium]
MTLKPEHEIDQFDCGQAELNSWLHSWARRAAEADTARIFVVCRGASRVVGYFTLSAGAVAHHNTTGGKAPRALRQNAPDPVPVLVLGRLAVDLSEQRQGLGGALVAEAMRRAAQASMIVGARALLVHALDDRLAGMYETLGFKRFNEASRTLYLPTRTIRGAL